MQTNLSCINAPQPIWKTCYPDEIEPPYESDSEEFDPYDSDLINNLKWGYITKDEKTELAYYLWWMFDTDVNNDAGLLRGMDKSDKLRILRRAYEAEKVFDSSLGELESDYCTDAASDWPEYVAAYLMEGALQNG